MKGPFKASHQPTTAEVKGVILTYFRRHPSRPVLIGQIATELKCPLSVAEGYLTDLCNEGEIQELTTAGAAKYGFRHGYLKIQKL